MLDRNSIFLVDSDMSIQDTLTEQDKLFVLSSPDLRRCFFLKTDATTHGDSLVEVLLGYCQEGWKLRVIAADSVASKLQASLAARKIAGASVRTFSKRAIWKFDYTSNALKCSVDPKIRVLIVDDSKTIRTLLQSLIARDAEFEVVGAIEDPLTVQAEIQRLKPDVMTLDIHMPGMNGVEVIRNVMRTHPVPTIMISSLGLQDGREVLTALQLGAVDYIQKPTLEELPTVAPVLLEKLKIASMVNLKRQSESKAVAAPRTENFKLDSKKIICIGSSTGGTEAIRQIFRSMPKDLPAVLITQHIPKLFSLAFAESLSREFGINVREAVDGDLVSARQVLVAPGGLQMEVVNDKKGVLRVRVFDGPPVNRHKPSVDVLFDSAAKLIGRNAVGVILTGMGADGAKGLLAMREAGAMTLGQDERSSVVYGMPKVAAEIGAVQKVCALNEMADAILQGCRSKQNAA